MNRRTFMKQAGASLLAASLAKSSTASSYARILGANDCIVLGQLGCGQRSSGHVHMVHMASKRSPVEVGAVCDLLESGSRATRRAGNKSVPSRTEAIPILRADAGQQ